MDPFLVFVFILSFVPCSLMVTCWEWADLLALLCVMFSWVFVTFPYGVLGQVWYLIVLIPDLCLLPYFNQGHNTVSLPVLAYKKSTPGSVAQSETCLSADACLTAADPGVVSLTPARSHTFRGD